MKKMLIAAIAASMSVGVYAKNTDCNICQTAAATGCVSVWDVKFNVKTTMAKEAPCAKCGNMTYRKQASAKIQGFIWDADPNCPCDDDAFFFGSVPRYALAFNKLPIAEFFSIFPNLIGKKGTELEAVGRIWDKDQDGLAFAGFGKYDLKNKRVKSVSGNFAGTLANYAASKCVQIGQVDYDICTDNDFSYDLTLIPTAAYGTWSIKYNSSLSKKLAKAMGVKASKAVVEPEEGDDEEIELDDEQVLAAIGGGKYGLSAEAVKDLTVGEDGIKLVVED